MSPETLRNSVAGVGFISALVVAAVFSLPTIVGWIPVRDFVIGIVIGASLFCGIAVVVVAVIFLAGKFVS
jgi:hypothetical protein